MPLTDPEVSVVVPTHRPVATVLPLLRSIDAQTLDAGRLEVVVVLDGPDDGRSAALRAYPAPYPLHVLTAEGRGRAAACNTGAHAARGRVLLLLDDDMRLAPDALAAHLARHGAGPVGVVGAAPIRREPGQRSAARFVGRRFDRHLAKLARPGYAMDVRDVYTGAFSVDRATFLGVGGFDSRFVEYGNEDGELAGRLMSAGVPLRFAPEAVAHQTYDKDFAALVADNLAKGRTAVQLALRHPDRAAESALRRRRRGSRARRATRAVLVQAVSRPAVRAALTNATDRTTSLLSRVAPRAADRVVEVLLDACFWAGARSPGADAARTVVLHTDGTSYGGVEEVVLTLAAAMDRTRWRPVIVAHPSPALVPLAAAARARGISVEEVGRAAGPRSVLALARAIRRQRPALVHVHRSWAASGSTGVLAARLAGCRTVVGTEHLFLPSTRRRTLLARRFVDRLVTRRTAVSEALAAELRARLGGPVTVVRNGIAAPEAAPPAADRRGPVVLVPARLDRHKGQDVALRALARLPDVRLLLAGDGAEADRLRALARELDVESRVTFLGRSDDVPALMAAADVVLLPSRAEGLPLVVLEAMALGRPVVATDVGGVAEAVHDGLTGVLVPPDDAAALTAALRCLLDDPAAARAMGERGRARYLAEFTADRMAEGYADVYDDALGRPRMPDPESAAVRALDWRFLVGRARLGRVVLLTTGVEAALGQVADVADSVADGADDGEADVVIGVEPSPADLHRAARLLAPDGVGVLLLHCGGTAARERCAAAGLPEVRLFGALPGAVGVSAWVPLDDRAAWEAVLPRRTHRPRSWASRSRRLAALRRLAHSGPVLATWGPGVARSTTTLLTPGRESVGKAVALVTPRGTAGTGVAVKWPRTQAGGVGLRREAETLRMLERHSAPAGSIPVLREIRETPCGPALVETLLDGEPLTRRLRRSGHRAVALAAADWLADLAADGRPATGRAGMRVVDGLPGTAADAALVANCRRAAEQLPALSPVVEHRDFAPWNVLTRRDGAWRVLDWESGVEDGLPVVDLWYFLTYAALAVERVPEDRLVEVYARLVHPATATGRIAAEAVDRYVHRVGTPTDAVPVLRVLTWATHVPSPRRGAVFARLAEHELCRCRLSTRA